VRARTPPGSGGPNSPTRSPPACRRR
jgi:hypothetical protein